MPKHPVLIERRGVFRTSLVRLLWQSEIHMITKRKNMLMCLHLKVCHYEFNIKIYYICFISYISRHYSELIFISDWLGKWTCDVLYTPLLSINTGCCDVSNSTFSTTWCNYWRTSLSNWRKMEMKFMKFAVHRWLTLTINIQLCHLIVIGWWIYWNFFFAISIIKNTLKNYSNSIHEHVN